MNNDDAERVWDLMDRVSVCMLASWDGRELTSRPMAAFVRRRNNAVYFLADARLHDDIKKYPKVCLAFADPADRRFVSLSGLAEVSADRAVIRELWATPARAWWDSPDDPSIRMLKVTPDDAQFWEGSGKAASTVKMTVPVMTGKRPVMADKGADTGKVAMQ